jgi:hypothetical protein
MTFEFTTRLAVFFTRYLEIAKPKTMERLDEIKKMHNQDIEMMDSPLTSQWFKGFRCDIHLEWEFDDEEEIDHETMRILVSIKYKDFQLGSRIVTDSDEKEWVESLVKTYTLCGCSKKVAEKDGWCKSCYPYVYKQGEECCICKEDEGVWIQLDVCKHIIHLGCWEKVEGLKCPLCRHQYTQHHWEYL